MTEPTAQDVTGSLLPSFRAFSRRILRMLGDVTDGRGYQIVRERQVVFRAQNAWEDDAVDRASTNAFWKLYMDSELWTDSDYQVLSLAHIELGVFRAPQFTDSSGQAVKSPSPSSIAGAVGPRLIKPVLQEVEAQQSIQIADSRLDELHAGLCSFWRNATFPFKVIVPILGLHEPPEAIDILDVLTLRGIAPQDQTELAECIGVFDRTTHPEIAALRACAYGSASCSEGESVDYQPHQFAAELLVTALRLLKPGGVGSPILYGKSLEPRSGGSGASASFLRDCELAHHGDYILAPSDVGPLKDLIDTLRESHSRSTIDQCAVAIRRFNATYARREVEDRLIDMSIALESTVLADVDHELKYRLAVRLPHLLGDNAVAERTNLLAKALYDARSSIVHNGVTLTDLWSRKSKKTNFHKFIRNHMQGEFTPGRFVQECEQLTRLTLREYLQALSMGHSVQDVNSSLERKIIGCH